MEFKPGDKVICINSSYGGSYIKGNTYVVKLYRTDGTIKTMADEHGSKTNGWAAKFFKKLKENKPYYPEWF